MNHKSYFSIFQISNYSTLLNPRNDSKAYYKFRKIIFMQMCIHILSLVNREIELFITFHKLLVFSVHAIIKWKKCIEPLYHVRRSEPVCQDHWWLVGLFNTWQYPSIAAEMENNTSSALLDKMKAPLQWLRNISSMACNSKTPRPPYNLSQRSWYINAMFSSRKEKDNS